MSGLRVVRAAGDPHTRGVTIGHELRDLIERSLDFYHSYFARRGVTSPQLSDLLTPYMVAAEKSTPDLMALITGMSEGALVPFMELFAVNAFEELEAQLEPVGDTRLFLDKKSGKTERCTSFAVTGDGFTLLGHNEQWLTGDMGNVAIVVELPGEGHTAVASPTYACCIPAVGINSHGIAMGIQSLSASDDGVGVPRVLVSRHTLASPDKTDVLRRSALSGRAGGYGYSVAIRGGDTFTVETSATRQTVIEGNGSHTNHYVTEELAPVATEASLYSRSRYNRVVELVAAKPPSTPEEAMAILADHNSTPASICNHPDLAEGEEAESVVFSMVCEVESGRMWVADGLPCSAPFEEIDLTDVIKN